MAKKRDYEIRVVKGEKYRVDTKTGEMRLIPKSHDTSFVSRKTSSVSSRDVVSAVRVLFIIILCISVFRIVQNRESLSLNGFLDMISNSPTISTDWISFNNLHWDAPKGFKWLANIFNTFVDFLSFAVFISIAAINAILYLLYFLRWFLL